MPTNSLQAKANTGVGTDNIAGITVPQGFVGASMMTDATGADITNRNHFPAAATQFIDQAGFSAVGSSVLDVFFNAPIVGTGVTYNQASGSLNIVAGTNTNAEFLARSVRSYAGSMRLRSSHIISSRIVNNNRAILLADLLGEGLAYNIVNSTTVDVTLTAHGYTSQMVGQFVLLGGITGAAGVPGRYAIASIPNVNTIRFTVAGWPASGTGTLTLFGRNYVRNLFTGTTVTNVNFDAQRNGWASGDTVATIQTTNSPGTVLMNELTGREVWLADKVRASSATPTILTRASRDENIPDPTVPLYVFLWSFNGTTAPASSTTWTLGHVAVELFSNQTTYIQGARANGAFNPLPVSFAAPQPVNATLQTGSAIVGNVGMNPPTLFVDLASVAIATTATAGPFTPTWGNSYQMSIHVTAVSGTNPTMDVRIEESDDNGTNYYTVYDFHRITAVGMYRSPVMPMGSGTRIRYVQTIGGTTPSFTRALTRVQSNVQVPPTRQLVDRVVNPNTLNATTGTLLARDAGNSTQLVVNMGAGGTAPAFQLEGSDDFGSTWYAIGSPLTAVVGATVQVTVNSINAGAIRARVSTPGSGATLGYVMLKAHD
jgi:hypothetical protein